jgi:type I restriction enzyme S subunit
MSNDWFFEKFALIADAPGAVDRMRELVLQLAVQGKLVPQDPCDEPAGKLFELDDELSSASLSELPLGWIWARLEQLAEINGGFAFKSTDYTEEGARVVRISDFDEFGFKDHKVVRHSFSAEFHKFTLEEQNILMAMTGGTVGKSYFVRFMPEVMVVNQRVATIKVLDSAMPRYIDIVIRSEMTQEVIRRAKNSTNDNISMGDIKGFKIPLPPLAEQKRIVAKVDELMGLCDELEAQHQERELRKSVLVRSSLSRFSESPTRENLGYLFHNSYDIPPSELRKSILTLAVQGKLVPQDPEDEPAEQMLKRLDRELTLEQRRRQADPLSPLSEDEVQYESPANWKWARFRDVAIIASNLVKPNDFPDFIHLAPDNIEKGNGILLSCKTVREDKVISSNHRFYPGQIIYSKIRPNLAKIVVVDFDGLCSADMYPIDAIIDPFYLHRFMLSEIFLVQAIKNDTRVAMPKINQMELNSIAVPVPPLAEQHRIVAKVDQLMALVDELERQQAASREKASNLLDAIVHEMTSGG